MVRKILKFILQEIKETFTPKWTWLLIYIPAMLIGMALFVHDRILFPPPPPPTFTYTPPDGRPEEEVRQPKTRTSRLIWPAQPIR